ncbi:metallophosphoesterase family protein [Roseivirga sp.]|uniref:metallophosphoesterase family protein n=1 Tax=Roseivirga sp. TaxID=1964215 RepID=UPI003B519065
MISSNHIVAVLIVFLCIGCSEQPPKHSFQHTIEEDAQKPWTSETFEDTETDFTFAIISDLSGGEREGIYSEAVAKINLLDPTFVLSIGDLIEGGTKDTSQLKKEWDSFDARTSKLNMPFFHLGGNHDLTNPTMRKVWQNRFGPRYYHFVFNDILFLMLDSEDYTEERMIEIYEAREEAIKMINGEIEGNVEESTYSQMIESRVGAISPTQTEYFKTVLNQYPDVKWTFLLMHKPLWMREDEKGLGDLEKALADRNYSVFNGHFHSFSQRIRNGQTYTILGTTGGSQNPEDKMSFDHFTLVRMTFPPTVTHLKLDGIIDEQHLREEQ